MGNLITIVNADSNKSRSIEFISTPVECPYCHLSHIPKIYIGVERNSDYIIFAECTNSNCQKCYVFIYDPDEYVVKKVTQSLPKERTFSDDLKKVSSDFCDIYNEAYAAEQMSLMQIAGVGYRKSLEFLIKDYVISLNPENEEEIKSKFLGNCIKENVNDEKIKEVAKRATWLGNDETHYVRRWENTDISNLKQAIELCLYWIGAEIGTKKLLEDMPDPKILK